MKNFIKHGVDIHEIGPELHNPPQLSNEDSEIFNDPELVNDDGETFNASDLVNECSEHLITLSLSMKLSLFIKVVKVLINKVIGFLKGMMVYIMETLVP